MPEYVRYEGAIRRLADGALIPYAEGNADYERYLSAVAVNPACSVDASLWSDLTEAQTSARAAIDAEAEAARLRYITPGSGQAQTYQMKLEQALAYQAAGEPVDASPWPFIEGESEALDIPPAAAAQAIIDTRDLWVQAGALIEKIRMGAKRSVTLAADNSAVAAATGVAIAQLRAI